MGDSEEMEFPVRIRNVHVKGNARIRGSYFENELKAGLKMSSGSGYNSIEEVQGAVIALNQRLQTSGLFKSVDASMNVPNIIDPATGESKGGNLEAVEVQFEIEENGVPKVEMETTVRPGSQSDVVFSVTGSLRSPFGYGETSKVKMGTSKMGLTTYDAELNVPHINENLDVLSLNASLSEEDKSFYQSHKERQTAFTSTLKSTDGLHELGGAWIFRDEVPRAHENGGFAKDATAGVLSTASSSSKLSLKYIGTPVDTRDNSFSPSKGTSKFKFKRLYLYSASVFCNAEWHIRQL